MTDKIFCNAKEKEKKLVFTAAIVIKSLTLLTFKLVGYFERYGD